MSKYTGPLCGKPTSKGTPCRAPQHCPNHPDPPMDQFLEIIRLAEAGMTYLVDNLGVEYRLSRIVDQITRPAQDALDRMIREVMMTRIREGVPREKINKEIQPLRDARKALTSWYQDRDPLSV